METDIRVTDRKSCNFMCAQQPWPEQSPGTDSPLQIWEGTNPVNVLRLDSQIMRGYVPAATSHQLRVLGYCSLGNKCMGT